jgi:hypothetical protein
MRMVVPRRDARLDATGGHVLCGSQHEGVYRCSREFGPVLELELPPSVASGRMRLALDPPPDYARDPNVALRLFRFPHGWQQRADGAWDRHGEAASDQRYAHYRDIIAWWTRLARLPHRLLHAVGADRPPGVVELPARAVCQRCRTISFLTSATLHVSSPTPRVSLHDTRRHPGLPRRM